MVIALLSAYPALAGVSGSTPSGLQPLVAPTSTTAGECELGAGGVSVHCPLAITSNTQYSAARSNPGPSTSALDPYSSSNGLCRYVDGGDTHNSHFVPFGNTIDWSTFINVNDVANASQFTLTPCARPSKVPLPPDGANCIASTDLNVLLPYGRMDSKQNASVTYTDCSCGGGTNTTWSQNVSATYVAGDSDGIPLNTATWTKDASPTVYSPLVKPAACATGLCGAANGTDNQQPTTNLCITGTTPSPISGSGTTTAPWTWTCTGATADQGMVSTCSATMPPLCGSANGMTAITSAPSGAAACIAGATLSGPVTSIPTSTASAMTWDWSCVQGSMTSSCTAYGNTNLCGTDNGTSTATQPSIQLCVANSNLSNSVTAISNGWSWTCGDTDGNTNSCGACDQGSRWDALLGTCISGPSQAYINNQGCIPSPTNGVTYTAGNYSFTVPAGVTTLYYKLRGGGGSGTTAMVRVPETGGGGGSGYLSTGWVSVVPGQALSLYVGIGGNGPANTGRCCTGNNGGSTVLSGVSAAGGGIGAWSGSGGAGAYQGGNALHTNGSGNWAGGGGGTAGVQTGVYVNGTMVGGKGQNGYGPTGLGGAGDLGNGNGPNGGTGGGGGGGDQSGFGRYPTGGSGCATLFW